MASDESTERITRALARRYRVERAIGAGGMATVYLADDLRHTRNVAVEVLREDLSASIGAARVQQEIDIAARLQHPHILSLLDSGHADRLLYCECQRRFALERSSASERLLQSPAAHPTSPRPRCSRRLPQSAISA